MKHINIDMGSYDPRPYPQARPVNGIYRYTKREWIERNFLPSFGLVGNQGHMTLHINSKRLVFVFTKKESFQAGFEK